MDNTIILTNKLLIFAQLKRYIKDSLFKNSIFIMITSISNAGFGFIFWLITARLYPKDDIGIAVAIMSSISLLVLFSRIGLDSAIVRYFPESDRRKVFSTAIIVTTFAALVLGTIFILGVNIWSPNLSTPVSKGAIPFLLLLIVNSIISIINNSFIAIRRTEFNLIQSIVAASRALFLIPLISLGVEGIIWAIIISLIIAVIISLIFLSKNGINFIYFCDMEFLSKAFNFSCCNYFGGLLITAPSLLLPILVLNVIGADGTAKYFMASSIASMVFMIPTSISISLLVEGSHRKSLKKPVIKASSAALAISTPVIIIIYLYGEYILKFIGRDYGDSIGLLRIMLLSTFFVAIFYIYQSIKQVQKDMNPVLILSILNFALSMGLSYILMLSFGIIGLGYAYFISYGVIAVIILHLVAKDILKGNLVFS